MVQNLTEVLGSIAHKSVNKINPKFQLIMYYYYGVSILKSLVFLKLIYVGNYFTIFDMKELTKSLFRIVATM